MSQNDRVIEQKYGKTQTPVHIVESVLRARLKKEVPTGHGRVIEPVIEIIMNKHETPEMAIESIKGVKKGGLIYGHIIRAINELCKELAEAAQTTINKQEKTMTNNTTKPAETDPLFVLANYLGIDLDEKQRAYLVMAQNTGKLNVQHLKTARQIVITWNQKYYQEKTVGCQAVNATFRDAAYKSKLLYGYAQNGIWIQAKRWGQA